MTLKLSNKLIIIIIALGLAPIVLFGLWTVRSAYDTSRRTVIGANMALADQVTGRVAQFMDESLMVLHSRAENFARAGLGAEQKTRLLRQDSVVFQQFAYIRELGLHGEVEFTSELKSVAAGVANRAEFRQALSGETGVSNVFMTDELVPAVEVFVPMYQMGEVRAVLMARLDLLHIWKLIEGLKVGDSGYLNLVTGDGRLFTSGNGPAKVDAIEMAPYADHALVAARVGETFEIGTGAVPRLVYATRMKSLYGWFITVEQPVAEAFAMTREMTQRLVVTVIVFIAVVLLAGWFLTRRWIGVPVAVLMRRVRELGAGKLSGRTGIGGTDEFGSLATTLDEMAENLITAQEELLLKERQAVLGRVASGIVHDLKHPVESVGNYVRELEERHADAEFRKDAIATVTREFTRVERFLENLKDLAKDIAHHPMATPALRLVDEALHALKPTCEKFGVRIARDVRHAFTAPLDLFSFPRLLNNLMANAVDAMADGGLITVTVDVVGSNGTCRGRITVADTGVGIEPERLPGLFDELKTTKKSGLGLGLALARKIARLHGGDITVESRVGEGTTFAIELPVVSLA